MSIRQHPESSLRNPMLITDQPLPKEYERQIKRQRLRRVGDPEHSKVDVVCDWWRMRKRQYWRCARVSPPAEVKAHTIKEYQKARDAFLRYAEALGAMRSDARDKLAALLSGRLTRKAAARWLANPRRR